MSVNVVSFECRELPINKVVVFNDRAEISRHISAQLVAGLNEVHVKNVTLQLVHDSVRVDGKGDDMIHEVTTQNKPALTAETDSPRVAELRSQVEAKKAEVESLIDRRSVLTTKSEALDKIVVNLGSGILPKDGSLNMGEGLLDNIAKFYGFYEDQSTSVRNQLRELKVTMTKAEEEVVKLEGELNESLARALNSTRNQTVVIVLESKEGGALKLEFVYQVNNAHWTPSYDFRVDTTAEKPSMQVSYYGRIYQNTNEDWNDVSLVLSTAQPCLGGEIPELGTLEASFYRPPMMEEYQERGRGSLFGSANVMMCAAPAPPPPIMMKRKAMARAVAVVQQHTLSTEFTIARKTTVPSGGVTTKVTIGITDLKPQLVHECVPSKNTSVFLTASAINESDLAFLSGQASIYLNNSFIAKTNVKPVSPGERFSCSLGVDNGVKVDYKPARKYHEQAGLINKSSSVITEQLITVKNTRSSEVLLTLREHIPRSTDEKMKIRVISPTPIALYEEQQTVNDAPKTPKEGARLNAQHNLEWTLKMAAGQVHNLAVKWTVDHPKDDKVEYNEKF